jgi:hypothetical protein
MTSTEMPLFAAVNGVVLQVQGDHCKETALWQTLCFFSFSGTMLNVGGTTASIFVILSGKQAIIQARRSILSNHRLQIEEMHLEAGGEALLLQQFNLGWWWRFEILFLASSFLSSIVFLLITLGAWAWLVTKRQVAAVVIVFLIIASLPLSRFLVPLVTNLRRISRYQHALRS